MDAIRLPNTNMRVAAIIHQIEETGISALPIVGLLAFLIGGWCWFIMADQLKRFGAEIFTINLLAVGAARDRQVLPPSVVAGCLAFAAQNGTMRVN